jgi:hypothetical protein
LSSSEIVNSDVSATAGIEYGKLNLQALVNSGDITAALGEDAIITGDWTTANPPATANSLVNRQYVQDQLVISGSQTKSPVVTFAAGSGLTGLGTYFGYTLNAGDRVYAVDGLVTDGIYIASSGAWVRSDDWDIGENVTTAYFPCQGIGTDDAVNGILYYVANECIVGTDVPNVQLAVKGLVENGAIGTYTLISGYVNEYGQLTTASSTLIDNSMVSSSAGIVDTKLATISTSGKVANSATTGTSTNAINTLVLRDVNGDFSANNITATLNGLANNASQIAITNDTTTNATYFPVFSTTNNGQNAVYVSSSKFRYNPSLGQLRITEVQITGGTFGSVAGVVKNNNTGLLTSSLITNADVDASAGIVDTKLATISTAGKVSNSATTGTDLATADTLVLRDANGDFSANIITATLDGNATTADASTTTNFVAVTDDTTTNATFYLNFSPTFSGFPGLRASSSKLTYVPSTGRVTATTVNTVAQTSGTAAVCIGGNTGINRGTGTEIQFIGNGSLVGVLNGLWKVGVGAASGPAYSFLTDPLTGAYLPAGGQFGIACSSTNVATFSTSGLTLASLGTGVVTSTTGLLASSPSLSTALGGTGQTTYTNGQLLIGNTTGGTLAKNTLTNGTGVTITNAAGSVTVAIGQSVSTTAAVTFSKLNITVGGPAATAGKGTLVAGTATINTTAVTAASLIFIQKTSVGSGANTVLRPGVITPGVSFTVVSNAGADTSTFNWKFNN